MTHAADAIKHLAKGPCKTAELAAAIGVPSFRLGHCLSYAVYKGRLKRTVIKEPQKTRTSIWSLP